MPMCSIPRKLMGSSFPSLCVCLENPCVPKTFRGDPPLDKLSVYGQSRSIDRVEARVPGRAVAAVTERFGNRGGYLAAAPSG